MGQYALDGSLALREADGVAVQMGDEALGLGKLGLDDGRGVDVEAALDDSNQRLEVR